MMRGQGHPLFPYLYLRHLRIIQKRYDTLDDFVIDWLHRDPRTAQQWLADPSRIPAEWSAAWIAEAERTR